jgi:glycosyltransferase involved in cell wall biosynthesis
LRHQSVSVVIPAYNEEKTVGDVINSTISIMDTLNVPYEILVVDDGSTDATGKIASQHKVTLLSNDQNHGKGYSLRKAIREARGEIVVTIDSDGEHKPKEIPDLLSLIFDGADIVAGSRFMGKSMGKQAEVTTRLNKIGNSLFNVVIMMLTRNHVTDSQTGFRAIRKEVLEELDLESDGFEIETEITIKSLANGFSFRETPITCERRKHDFSKLRLVSDGRKILRAILVGYLYKKKPLQSSAR